MKKPQVIISLSISLVLILASGCQSLQCGSTPDALISKMESLVETVKAEKKSSNARDWETWDHEFINYYENCYDGLKSDMDAAQKGKFIGLSIRYITIRLGNEIKSMFSGDNEDETSGFTEVLKGIAEELRKEK